MFRGLAPLLLALLAAPASAAEPSAERVALGQALDDLIARSALGQARVGLQIVRLDDGEVVYARNADELLNPASNVKLFTTAAALVRLGPEFRFDTEFLVDRQPDQKRVAGPPRFKSGDIRGPLYVRGKGDPSITAERLWSIANDLWYAGLRSVSGDLVLDDGYFDEERVGPGFDQESSDRSYMAPTGALSLDSNVVKVHIAPGASRGARALVQVEPESPFFLVENRTVTGSERSLRRLYVASLPMGERQKIVVSGRIPLGAAPTRVWKKIDNPSFFFGQTLKTLLAKRGIRVRGKVRRGSVPAEAVPYLLRQSETLDLVLKRTNKNSSNFVAEQLVKTLGAQASGGPGSWRSGIAAVEDFLTTEAGLAVGSFVMKNGSGLNDTNRFSAAQINRLLRHMWRRFPLAPEYLSSLAIAGKDGTVHYRMEGSDAVGRLRAKTGTLENVSALSGYVQSVGGEKLAFALMVNDFPGRLAPVISAIDAVGIAIASLGQPGAPAQALARALGAALLAGPLEELRARVGTYDALASMRDPRNITFLRTALRAERDPALRAVIAEAILRSDPDDGGGARLLLENFDPGPDGFGRLRTVAREQGTPTPVLPSLLYLAGEGSADALGHLLYLAPAAAADDGLREELLEPMAEIAHNAPDELIAALRAREGSSGAALELLAKSLARAGGEHPFPAALKRTEGSTDAQLAVFAQGLDETLRVRIAAERAARAALKEGAPRPEAAPDAQPDAEPAPAAPAAAPKPKPKPEASAVPAGS